MNLDKHIQIDLIFPAKTVPRIENFRSTGDKDISRVIIMPVIFAFQIVKKNIKHRLVPGLLSFDEILQGGG